MTPAVPPMNSDGKMGPPTNPLPWLTAKVSILATSVATSVATSRPGIAEHGVELIAAREHRQRKGHADEPEHHPAQR